ncbi:MAG TPA: hypothetical protein VFH71_13565 [Rhodanobacteraceae bacterium]|nr:hypothetical protein [Rhodanobacteraceae bacterium]
MSAGPEKAFLVFSGGNDRAVLGFLRALRLCGESACIVARTPDDRILRTHYRKDVRWVRPDHSLTIEIFARCVQRVREKAVGSRPLVVLPSTEYFNAFLLGHRTDIERMGCEIPLVEAPVYDRLTGKRTSTDFFAAAGFSVPREWREIGASPPPVIAKPLRNISRGGQSLYPWLLRDAAQFAAFRKQADIGEYFFQEYVRGDSLYLLMYLPPDGAPELTWSQRNLLQQPGGKSMLLAEPADFHHSDTAKRFVRVLRETGFHGLGMIEVIRAAKRDVFIEMNPRIWGPIQFCLDQHQPLLQAFIGESLHGDPARYIRPRSRTPRKKYFWLGGLADTLAAGKQPDWHAEKRSVAAVILGSIACDVYLRMDSWRCFFHDLKHAYKAGRAT